MRQGTMLYRAVEALVAQDKPELHLTEVRAVVRPLVADEQQVQTMMRELVKAGYVKKVVHITNRARRVFGRPVRTGEPPNSEYCLSRRFCYDWGRGYTVNTGHLVADALANRSAIEFAWAEGRRHA